MKSFLANIAKGLFLICCAFFISTEQTLQTSREETELGNCTCEGTDYRRINCRGGLFLPTQKLENVQCSGVDWITIRDTSLNYANLPELLLKQNPNASISANYVGVKITKLQNWSGKYLSVQGNHIGRIDVARLLNVELLDVSHNQLTTLNLSAANNLKQLFADRNNIREVIGPSRCSLVEFQMEKNNLDFLPTWLRACPDLESLEVSKNSLAFLDVSGAYKLRVITAQENELNEFTPPTNCSLVKIGFQRNNFTTVPNGIGRCLLLEHVDFRYNNIRSFPDWFLLHFLRRYPESQPRIIDRTLFLDGNAQTDLDLSSIFQRLGRMECERQVSPQHNCSCTIERALSTRWSGTGHDIWTYTVPVTCTGEGLRIWIDR